MATLSIDPTRFRLLYRHGEPVPISSTLSCGAGQCAVFLQWGRVAGMLGAGEHVLDPQRVPFLSVLVEQRPEGAVLGGELLLANTAGAALPVPVRGELETAVEVRVADPVRMLAELAGPADPAAIERFVTEQLTAVLVPVFAERSAAELADAATCRALAEPALAGVRERLAPMSLEILGIRITPKGPATRARTEAMSAADAEAILAASATASTKAPAPAAAATPPKVEPGLAVGSRVRTSHGGTWYSGSISELKEAQCQVEWDSGQKSWIGLVALEPEPTYPGAHPAGTRVLAQWSDGGFYPATVRHYNGTSYQVAWDNGTSSWLSPGQLKLA